MNNALLPGATPCVTPNLARFLARLDRPALEAVAQAAIDRLDEVDGDTDREPDDFDMCPAGDDGGTGMVWVNPGDGQVGDPIDAEDDDASLLVDQSRPFIAGQRRRGTLHLRLGGVA
ncbi:hypothetical protein BV98_002207 [Sphingobium herbicidovorans NBRC 16415]|jgi:hypothetical protein|uniref:Uncharacterized protein n=1 Tax=Sphingobium herbicidovorans (strain ATCC 700291 / DSM 11019 / CCUG 56400 / KCTC 2939 / LMG 18315 / NBRC 16415 / MH) TaxID=1219045 RepID=A0A086P9G6_SPHHM|nr:hypothetical protein [Sphingobium herbicidovorans]KFG90034.1 hypothetical protein BV98_002207 [Sphingobium herbicidovorans NBRC 16415]